MVVAVVIASVLALAFVVTQIARPLLTGPIASITFHQSKAVPDYDGSTYEITDAAKLAEFAALSEKHLAIPELVSLSNITRGCTGGTSTTAEIAYTSGRVGTLQIYTCGESGTIYGGFLTEATSLLSSWKQPDA
jgi:hypothetical protein